MTRPASRFAAMPPIEPPMAESARSDAACVRGTDSEMSVSWLAIQQLCAPSTTAMQAIDTHAIGEKTATIAAGDRRGTTGRTASRHQHINPMQLTRLDFESHLPSLTAFIIPGE